jgi:hypothetical protein
MASEKLDVFLLTSGLHLKESERERERERERGSVGREHCQLLPQAAYLLLKRTNPLQVHFINLSTSGWALYIARARSYLCSWNNGLLNGNS